MQHNGLGTSRLIAWLGALVFSSTAGLAQGGQAVADLMLYDFRAAIGERDVGQSVTTADYDNDGFTDIAYVVTKGPLGSPAFEIVIRSGKDGREIGRIVLWPGVDGVRLVSTDQSGNGIIHVVAGTNDPAGSWGSTGLNSWHYWNGQFTFVFGLSAGLMPSISDVATGDLDANGSGDWIVSTREAPARILVIDNNGLNIVRVHTATSNLVTGSAVACDDIDGDGFDDVIFGDRTYFSTIQNQRTGAVHVYSGLTGNHLITFEGEGHDDRFGTDVEAGDIDGDGKAEIVVGAPLYDVGSLIDAGAAYVYSGGNYAQLHKVTGSSAGVQFGRTVAITNGLTTNFFAGSGIDPPSSSGRVELFRTTNGAHVKTLQGSTNDPEFGAEVIFTNLIDNSSKAQVVIGDPNAANTTHSRTTVVSTDISSLMGSGCGTNAPTIAINSVRTNQPVTLTGTALAQAPVFLLGTIFTPGVPTNAMNCPVYSGASSAVLGLVTADTAGNWSLGVLNNPLPPGIEVTVQAWSVDPTATALTASPGLRFEVQP